jgi:transcriptional antiterminator
MSNKNNLIKSELLSLYKKGKSESEAHEELSKSRSSYEVSLKAVNKWFEIFKSQVSISNDYNITEQKNKLTNEQLISLVKANPKLNMKELARLTGVSRIAISNKIKKINAEGDSTNYAQKSRQKFVDEYLIDLVDKNPDLSMAELAKIAGTTAKTISNRIKQINSNGQRIRYTNKTGQSSRGEVYFKNPLLEDEYLIKLVDNNPGLSMEKIAILTGSSQQTISRRIKHINKYGKRVNYQKKDGKKFTDEFLIRLIEENPDFNQEELAALTDVKQFTISNRLNEIKDTGKSTNYCEKRKPMFTDEYLINLINENPDFSMAELAKVAETSQQTISRRIKELSGKGIKVNYTYKKAQKVTGESTAIPKLTDEYIINLVNENPELNMKELAKIAGISCSSISNRIRKINSNGERVKYIYKKASRK